MMDNVSSHGEGASEYIPSRHEAGQPSKLPGTEDMQHALEMQGRDAHISLPNII